jgi:proteasome lid subunit RPN8/RPN11
MLLQCPRPFIASTLNFLKEAGQRRQECVVLWLGKRAGTAINVRQCYRPIQRARADQFHIPPEGMAALQAQMRADRLMVAAQIHSHPNEAFHSRADDEWAIVRHEGALSLVVPRFAVDTFPETFFPQTKVYRFSNRAKWDEVLPPEVPACLKII